MCEDFYANFNKNSKILSQLRLLITQYYSESFIQAKNVLDITSKILIGSNVYSTFLSLPN